MIHMSISARNTKFCILCCIQQ